MRTREFAIPAPYRSPFQRVAQGIHTLPGQSLGRVYVVEGPDGLTLVDTGLKLRAGHLLDLIARAGHSLRQVRRVLLTHTHPDHVGGLQMIRANSDVEIVTSLANAGELQGRVRPVADGDVLCDVLNGLTVIGTPGHLPGHLSFWLPERGVLFSGDALASWGGLGMLPSPMHFDSRQVQRDVVRLARLHPEVICCGHGPPVVREAAARLSSVAEAIAR